MKVAFFSFKDWLTLISLHRYCFTHGGTLTCDLKLERFESCRLIPFQFPNSSALVSKEKIR